MLKTYNFLLTMLPADEGMTRVMKLAGGDGHEVIVKFEIPGHELLWVAHIEEQQHVEINDDGERFTVQTNDVEDFLTIILDVRFTKEANTTFGLRQPDSKKSYHFFFASEESMCRWQKTNLKKLVKVPMKAPVV